MEQTGGLTMSFKPLHNQGKSNFKRATRATERTFRR